MRPVAIAVRHPFMEDGLNQKLLIMTGILLALFFATAIIFACHPWDEEQGFGEQGFLAAFVSRLVQDGGWSSTFGPNGSPGGEPPTPFFQGVIPAPAPDIAYSEPDTVTEVVNDLNENPKIVKEYPPHEVDKVPELVWMMYPEFPEKAKVSGINGKVVLEILVDEKGYPIEITLVEETPKEYGFGEATKLAAESAVFKPAEYNDESVRCRIKLPVEFNSEY